MEIKELMLEMRDGIRLQTFIYTPTLEPGKDVFPALFALCVYGTEKMDAKARVWAGMGYVVVLQNVRGRNKSEGGPVSRDINTDDGYDTMEWIVRQAWSNKMIGTIGRSFLARTQVACALLSPHPAHRAMIPEVLPYGRNSRLGGAFMFSQIPQWMYMTQSGSRLLSCDAVDWMPHLYKLPITSTLDDIGGPIEEYRDIITDVMNLDTNHTYYVKNMSALNTPNLMITGWYDHCGTGSLDFFMQTMQFASEEQKKHTHLIIGPWDHSFNNDGMVEYDFGSSANLDLMQIQSDFLENHLKNNVPENQIPRVKIFIMGKNQWRDEEEWPLSRAKDSCFYLHSTGEVHGAWMKGNLSTSFPEDETPDKYCYDPADPVPTLGGANSGPARSLPMKKGPRDQQITLYRDDVVTYYSDPLDKPLEVTGMLKLVLFASSSAMDTDFTAKLMDISTNGNARILSDGIVRARFRNGIEREEPIIPGQVYRYEIDLWSTSNEFQTGHRIGLAISSSNFPRFNRNLNTGKDNEHTTECISASQVIYHDREYPSHLVLPVIDD
jgi:predicted acyl esterase